VTGEGRSPSCLLLSVFSDSSGSTLHLIWMRCNGCGDDRGPRHPPCSIHEMLESEFDNEERNRRLERTNTTSLVSSVGLHQQHNLIHFNSPKPTSNTKEPATSTMRFPTPLLALLTLLTLALGAPSSLKPRATDGWTIQDFTRDCRDEDICIYGFTLDIYGFAQQHCTIIDVAEPGPATTHSWYNIPCEEVRQIFFPLALVPLLSSHIPSCPSTRVPA